MKPVAIFRASPTEGPGYFATYLERRSIAWQLVSLDANARVPRDARAYAGPALHKSVIFETLQRIADGHNADAEFLGQRTAGKPGAKRHLAAENPVPNP